MATNRPGRTEGDDNTRAQAPAEGASADAAAGGGAGGAGDAGGAGAAGGTGGQRGGRRGGTTAAGGQASGTTRSRSRKSAGSSAADTQGGEGGSKRGTGRTTGGTRKTGGRASGAKGTQSQGPDLRSDLREFASSRPGGWNHQEWTGLLGNLRERGHDVSDPEQIGRQLEQERLALRLEQIEGVGPRHVRALSERFRTLYSLRQASVDEIAEVPNVSRQTAERVHEQLR